MVRHGSGFRVAFCAMIIALSVLFLLGAELIPSAQLALCCLAGFFVGAVVATLGYGSALLCWAGASLLGLILLPGKGSALLFLMVFGLYPMVNSLVEKLRPAALAWIVKLAWCNALLAVCLLGLSRLLFPELKGGTFSLTVFWLAGVGLFVLYDVTFTRVMIYYQGRILPLLRRQK